MDCFFNYSALANFKNTVFIGVAKGFISHRLALK
tara:strand:- start:3655 stop:3756 length:102 start_codon:yes stop_codon:yes gene_type:complete